MHAQQYEELEYAIKSIRGENSKVKGCEELYSQLLEKIKTPGNNGPGSRDNFLAYAKKLNCYLAEIAIDGLKRNEEVAENHLFRLTKSIESIKQFLAIQNYACFGGFITNLEESIDSYQSGDFAAIFNKTCQEIVAEFFPHVRIESQIHLQSLIRYLLLPQEITDSHTLTPEQEIPLQLALKSITELPQKLSKNIEGHIVNKATEIADIVYGLHSELTNQKLSEVGEEQGAISALEQEEAEEEQDILLALEQKEAGEERDILSDEIPDIVDRLHSELANQELREVGEEQGAILALEQEEAGETQDILPALKREVDGTFSFTFDNELAKSHFNQIISIIESYNITGEVLASEVVLEEQDKLEEQDENAEDQKLQKFKKKEDFIKALKRLIAKKLAEEAKKLDIKTQEIDKTLTIASQFKIEKYLFESTRDCLQTKTQEANGKADDVYFDLKLLVQKTHSLLKSEPQKGDGLSTDLDQLAKDRHTAFAIFAILLGNYGDRSDCSFVEVLKIDQEQLQKSLTGLEKHSSYKTLKVFYERLVSRREALIENNNYPSGEVRQKCLYFHQELAKLDLASGSGDEFKTKISDFLKKAKIGALTARNSKGFNAFHIAAALNRPEILEGLFERIVTRAGEKRSHEQLENPDQIKADIFFPENITTNSISTPLHFAVSNGNLSAISILLQECPQERKGELSISLIIKAKPSFIKLLKMAILRLLIYYLL